MQNLLIVESPTKARTIGKMLGNDFKIIASMGHIRDLPEHAFGIDIANAFTPEYIDTPRSKSILKELRSAAAKSDRIFLATDPDREGEAIAWHLKNAISETLKKDIPFHRITFHEITRQAVEQAIANCSDIDLHLVDAQQARRVLDRIVGYQVSPLLWRKLEKGSSAGRVQSAALRMVVERERAVLAFVPEEYWAFSILFNAGNHASFRGRLFKIDSKEFHIRNGSDAAALEDAIRKGSSPLISDVSRQDRKRNPYPPYTTSTLQQAANQILRFSASSTMRYAQQLYEGIEIGTGESAGLITYMRTDSVTIAREAQIAAKDFIVNTFGAEYAPAKFNVYKNKAAAQEAHEAIRPTDVRRTPEQLAPYLDAQQLKLYTMIWKRFVASQMASAKQELITADVNINGSDGKCYTFRSNATVTTFPGFLKLSEDSANKSSAKEECSPDVLRNLKKGDSVSINKFDKEQKFTEPPPRFTEASLIKQLEENGIGRPSTYATILRTIQDRDYVKREQGKLIPTELGFSVNDFLVEKLPELFDIGFTAQMEQQLDDVEAGSLNWVELMTDFYSRFSPWVEAAKNSGAPPEAKARELLSLFDNIQFAQPQKNGSRKFDDAKFVTSIRDKFEKTAKLSEKQYQALVVLASRYADQFDRSALSGDLQQALEAACEAEKLKAEKLKQRPPAPEGTGYAPVFAAFSKVEFAAPRNAKKSSFSEEKFFKSLKKQSESGSTLSEKQLAALKRMAVKYQEQLSNKDEVFALLQIDPAELAASEENKSSVQAAGKCAALLEQLSRVTQWATPEKRGRFTFDDKKFYQSLARQYADKKTLSDKQLAALQKLAEKYLQPASQEK